MDGSSKKDDSTRCCITFKSNDTVRNEYAPLSNFWPFVSDGARRRAVAAFPNVGNGSFVIDGIRFASVEHWFQANKYKHQPDVFARINRASTAYGAKQENNRQRNMGNAVDVASWNRKRESVMMQGLNAKFEQNPDLADVLVSTGDAELREQGLDFWCGPNGRLGRMLMQIRSEIMTKKRRVPSLVDDDTFWENPAHVAILDEVVATAAKRPRHIHIGS